MGVAHAPLVAGCDADIGTNHPGGKERRPMTSTEMRTVLPRLRSPIRIVIESLQRWSPGGENEDYNDLMQRDLTMLLREALRLSAQDRAALTEALVTSLDEDVDDDAEAAWRSEVERRIAELDSGSMAHIPWHVVRQRLFERARRRALRRLHDGLDLQWTPQRSRDALHER
jgi:putative addiction module component (TIGR02574 family)